MTDSGTENGNFSSGRGIISFPQYTELSEEIKKLHTEISMLVLERDDLILQVCPNLEAAYLLKIGGLEYKVYAAQCNYLRQKRRFELIAAKNNRGEKTELHTIEAQLNAEFEEYRLKLREKMDEMNAAAERSNHSAVLTVQEAKELKSLYRSIAKRLHPDLRPDLTDSELQLFLAAKEAYANGNLVVLRAIAETAEGVPVISAGADSLAKLNEQKNRLSAVLKQLEEDISRIKSNYPYTLKPLVEDGNKLKKHRAELEETLQTYNTAAAEYEKQAEELIL